MTLSVSLGDTRRRQARSAVALDELDGREERAALVAVRQGMVLHQVPAEDRGLRYEVRVRLDAAKASLRRGQRRLGQSDAVQVRDRLGGKPEHPFRDEQGKSASSR